MFGSVPRTPIRSDSPNGSVGAGPSNYIGKMKTAAWSMAIGLGAVVAVLLGLSMLAASETTREAEDSLVRLLPLTNAEIALMSNQMTSPGRVPCIRMTKPTVIHTKNGTGTSYSFPLYAQTPAEEVREAQCLYRHGFMSDAGLDEVTRGRTVVVRHGVARLMPLSLQVVASPLPLTVWSVLLALEVAACAVFALRRRKGGRRAG